MAYGYTPTNPGWGAAATYAKQQTSGGSYNPRKPPLDPSPSDPRYSDSPAAPPGSPSSPGSPGGGNRPSYLPSYNWQNDPYLMQIKALTAKNRQEAEAGKNDQLRKAILASGLSSLAEKLFGGDQAFIDAVKANPFSGVGEIRNTYEGPLGRINQANEDLNQDNLFFSSYRTGVVLPDIFRQRQKDEYDLTNQTQAAVDSVNAAYANKLNELQMQELEAERQAWLQAMQMGAYGGYGPSGGGGGGSYTSLGVQYDSPERGGRPGEWADLPVVVGWNPARNSDAQYDMSGAQRQADGTYVGPQGARYDEKGRRI